ncbi:MAG: dipeptidase, partial [Bacteroidia bacterium]|nr:dipeptidase [Bacteroidia bacterium]
MFVFGCAQETKKNVADMTDDEIRAWADEIAQKYIIADGHVDLPYRLKVRNFRFEKELLGIPVETEDGDFDYVRAKKGGLDAPFMSIYIPASYQSDGIDDSAKVFADSLIDMVQGIIEIHPDKFATGNSTAEVEAAFASGKLSLPMGMENGAPILNDLSNVQYFADRGIRYITLTHSKDNQICDSSYDTTRTWNGLSPFGREVIPAMNKAGIMIDISHVSDSAFYQAIEISEAPVIASHSSLRHFTPEWERNMNDDMLKVLGENNGVVMINFGSTFLDKSVAEANRENRNKLGELLDSLGLDRREDAAKPIIEEFRKDHPSLYADVDKVVEHIERAIKIAGINSVGFGSDFDGVGDSLPTGLKDVSQYPNVIYALLKKG